MGKVPPAEVGLVELPGSHPFANIALTDNIVRFELGYTAMNARTMHKLARALDVQPLDILNYDTQTNDLGWLLETMRHDASVVRLVLAKLEPRGSARAA